MMQMIYYDSHTQFSLYIISIQLCITPPCCRITLRDEFYEKTHFHFLSIPNAQVANKIHPYAIAVHGLATQDSKAPAARVLVYQFRSIMVSAPEWILLNLLHFNRAIIFTECIHRPSTDSVLTEVFILCYFYHSDFISVTLETIEPYPITSRTIVGLMF